MSLIFYFAPMSTASITEAVIAELGIPCDRVELNISIGDTRKPEFLKINPNGRVPAIDYSLADTHLQGIVSWLGWMPVDMAPFPNVTAWLKRCHDRPAIAQLMAG